MAMQAAVLGANGYVGKHLCKKLTEQGVGVLRLSSGEECGISLETGLFSNSLVFPETIDTVYYLAQSPRYHQTPEQSAHLISVNCVAAVQAAEAARRAGVKRFIYASTGNVYEPSFSPLSESAPIRQDNWYSLSKVMAENALNLYRSFLDITIVRIFGVYGPEQNNKIVPNMASKIELGQDIFLHKNLQDPGDKDGHVISLIYIDDLVCALSLLPNIQGCEYINLAGIEEVSIRKLAMELAKCMGMRANLKPHDSPRSYNLISNTAMQIQLLDRPLVPLSEGIARFCRARMRAQ